jgi:glycosyltransferase involved in cell wall biosynthesis
MKPIISILTPAVYSRLGKVQTLAAKIEAQGGDVEHLVLYDNKRRTIGEKRDALLRASLGKYVAFVDDDDDIAPEYVAELLSAAKENPDVITFWQHAEVDGKASTVVFKLGQENGAFLPGGTTLRNAWHVCAWRRDLAIQSWFPPTNYGEDWAFAARLCAVDNLVEKHIPKVLQFYNHSAKTTEAPAPK